jgi:hypothetical protein
MQDHEIALHIDHIEKQLLRLLGDSESAWAIIEYTRQNKPRNFGWIHNRQAYRALCVPDKAHCRHLLTALSYLCSR